MPLTPETFGTFGGLRLDASLDEIGGDSACNLLDVDWGGTDGLLRTRDGTQRLGEGTSPYDALFAHSRTSLVSRRGSKLIAMDGSGSESSEFSGDLGHLSFANVGTPSASYTYIGGPTTGPWRFDGSSFVKPKATVGGEAGKAMPQAKFLAAWGAGGNRLVVAGTWAGAGPAGLTSSPSHVWFSEPGNPEGFETTAYVQLSPGDGETIRGCCVWGGQVFVFKKTKMFVFYGIETHEEGKPVFNYREVDLGTTIEEPGQLAGEQIAVGASGVYIVSVDGVLISTGGAPSTFSDALSPLTEDAPLMGPAAVTLGNRRWKDAQGIALSGNRLFVGLASEEAVDRLLVYRFDLDAWSVWSAALNAFASWDALAERPVIYFTGDGSAGNHLFKYNHLVPEDRSVEWNPYWQSGFYDSGSEDEKTFTQARLYGSGEVTVKTAKDFGELGKGKAFKMGAGTAIKRAEQQRTQTGALHSHQFSGKGPWSIQRFVRYLESGRDPDTTTRN